MDPLNFKRKQVIFPFYARTFGSYNPMHFPNYLAIYQPDHLAFATPTSHLSSGGEKKAEAEVSLVTEEVRANAEVHYGDEICQERSKQLLQEVGLPRGLLPLRDIIEFGYVKETGFVWFRQKKKIEHYFDKIGENVSYAPEIIAHVEKRRIKNLTGVKVKKLFLWISPSESYVNDPPDGKIVFKIPEIPAGLSRSLPASAFELDDDKQ